MRHKRQRLPFAHARLSPFLQQIKRACASVRQRRRASQLKKRSRILIHALHPTLFFCRLEIPCSTHRKQITHGRLLYPNQIGPDEPEPPKQKRLTLPTVSRSTSKWLLPNPSHLPQLSKTRTAGSSPQSVLRCALASRSVPEPPCSATSARSQS